MAGRNIIANISTGVYKRITRAFFNPYKKIGFGWLKMRLLKNLPEKKVHTITLLGKPFLFYSRDEFLHSLDEIFIGEIYKQQLQENPFIIDCGANIGLSVIYLKNLFPDAKLIAFEPDDTNFKLLKSNIDAFHFKGVELRKEAVWIEHTTLKFSSEGSLMSRIQEKESHHTIEVKAIRLKDVINGPVHFLKIDIEGAEYRVLKDIEEKLPLVEHMFIEYHGTFEQNEQLNDLLQTITNKGFRYYMKEAIDKHPKAFERKPSPDYDLQLNIFCFRN